MKIHFVGICGKLNAGLAISLRKHGHYVTGSDKAFYPPMSDLLNEAGLPIMVGYKASHIDETKPDLVAYGAAINDENVEVIRSKELGIKLLTPTELVEKFVVKPNSIVISGNYGKTTITGLLVHIFNCLNLNPSYMIGGVVKNIESVVINDSIWSIIEGDEYPASKNGISKFFYYHPKYLVITNVSWDHTDVFKSESDYRNNFINLIKTLDKDGRTILNGNDRNLNNDKEFLTLSLDKDIKCEVLTSKRNNYDLEFLGNKIRPKIFGRHNYDNISLAISVLESCFDKEFLEKNSARIINAINSFVGVLRRLEIKFSDSKVTVVDDFAHNPEKFEASISAIHEQYSDSKLILIIEPNMGNRTKEYFHRYMNVFNNEKIIKIFIPRWRNSQLKDDSIYMDEIDFANGLNNFIKQGIVETQLDDLDLENKLLTLINESTDKLVILFMGSEPFRGVINNLVIKLSN